ncbi:MAG: lipolytic protein G-D-S-L family [Paludibacteraceae bacterium]|nr:lipolytic protein G-D-S-L family [Paludibacteraceae bacterium]
MKNFYLLVSALLLLLGKPVQSQEVINLLFIGNSITYGDQLSDPATQAPPVICRALVEEATGITTTVYNGGHCGITTWGFLPGREDFNNLIKKAQEFRTQNGGRIYICIMLGTNDSACTATEGAPVSNNTYGNNMRTIINTLNSSVPGCKILLNYPLWYSETTYNGAMYLKEGQERLHGYYPVLDAIAGEYDNVYPGRRDVWEFFKNNQNLFTNEMGNAGCFYLHPNAEGARVLGGIWANSLLEIIRADNISL